MNSSDQQSVDNLLTMYTDYKAVLAQITQLSSELAKAKLRGLDTQLQDDELTKLNQQLQQISDDMTFDNPIIWMAYKHLAYQNETQPILNMADFRLHCSKSGYICTKRFEFLDEYAVTKYNQSLKDNTIFPDKQSLEVVYTGQLLKDICTSEQFMTQWRAHEYYRIDNKVAKWQSYSSW